MLKLPGRGLDVENHAFSVSSVLAITVSMTVYRWKIHDSW